MVMKRGNLRDSLLSLENNDTLFVLRMYFFSPYPFAILQLTEPIPLLLGQEFHYLFTKG